MVSINRGMYYILYQTTNMLTGEFYVGVHRSRVLDDNYLGSGIRLMRAVNKYGRHQFKRTILEQFDREEDMFTREREVVTREFVNRPDTYNLVCGGRGLREQRSWVHTDPEAQRAHARKAALIGVEKRRSQNISLTETTRRKTSETLRETNDRRTANGHKHPNVGKRREQTQCPHCGVVGAKNTLLRWHFDNCKCLTQSVK